MRDEVAVYVCHALKFTQEMNMKSNKVALLHAHEELNIAVVTKSE